MTHLEAKAEFEKRLLEAKSIIESTKNSEFLEVITSVSYMNDDLEETSEFDECGETHMFGSVEVFLRGNTGEEDPSVTFSIVCGLKNDKVRSAGELDAEYDEFDRNVNEFTKKLSSAEDTYAFIVEEYVKAVKEGEEAVKEFEKRLDATVKKAKICAAIFIGIIIILAIIKLI